jgi:hypothetical protein
VAKEIYGRWRQNAVCHARGRSEVATFAGGGVIDGERYVKKSNGLLWKSERVRFGSSPHPMGTNSYSNTHNTL